jgi:hypothetical protein
MNKDLFIEMLKTSKTKYTVRDHNEVLIYRHGLITAETIIQVDNTNDKLFNASRYCYSYWIFDKDGELLGVYHYEC